MSSTSVEMKQRLQIVGFAIGLLLIVPTCLPAQNPGFDELRERLESGEILRAGFTHEYRDSYTGEETRTEGVIWISRQKYRVEGESQTMVVDGEVSRVYDAVRNRLLISSYEEDEDDFAPSRMFQGVDESYDISEQRRGGHTFVTLMSDDPFALFSRVVMTLDDQGVPLQIEATDQAENVLITRFREGRFTPADPALFELVIPEDAERVDLRH